MSTTAALPPTLSVEEASRVLGVSRRHAYNLAADGRLPCLRLGKRLRIPTHRVVELLEARPESEDA